MTIKATKAILVFLCLTPPFVLSSATCFGFDINSEASTGNESVVFSYIEATGRGPSRWGQLDPNWQACGTGKLQSPINLLNPNVQVSSNLGQLQKSYKPTSATIKSHGYNIMVSWKGDAGTITINGTDYNLQHCHWHTLTEHAINGRRHNLELHMVHSSSDGETAVIGVLYRYGPPNPFLSRMLPYIKSATKEEKDLGIVNPEDVVFWSNNYYRYIGSLTTPPCTEGVIWTIFPEVRTVSAEQVIALRNAVDDGFEMNARPVQALNGRAIYLYLIQG